MIQSVHMFLLKNKIKMNLSTANLDHFNDTVNNLNLYSK